MSIMGSDMSSVLDDEDKLRVLPILGKGSVQNLIDILRLKNIDMGFVTTDALEFAKADRVIKYKAVVNRVTAATMEPRAALSFFDAAADRMTVYTTLQRAFVYRAQVAEMIGASQ